MPSKRRRKSAKIHSKVFDEVTKMIKQGKSTNVIAEELSGRGVPRGIIRGACKWGRFWGEGL